MTLTLLAFKLWFNPPLISLSLCSFQAVRDSACAWLLTGQQKGYKIVRSEVKNYINHQ